MPSIATTKPTGSIPEAGEVRFENRHRSGLNVKAAGVEEEGQFIVLGGSEAPLLPVVTPPKRAPAREESTYAQGVTTMKSVSFPVSRLRP
jgi:hypothetical protein